MKKINYVVAFAILLSMVNATANPWRTQPEDVNACVDVIENQVVFTQLYSTGVE
ncbi:MAG: hypothetical protein CNLJKLNK_01119 [Holosporales bacterium]